MSRLNSEIKSMKRNLILKKASEMFEIFGYDEMKVSDLAKDVGISVGTVYTYFTSKEGLYNACIGNEVEAVYLILKTLFEQELSYKELLEKSIQIKFSIMSKKRNSIKTGLLNNKLFFESQQISHKEIFQKIYRLYLPMMDELKRIDVESMQLVYSLNSLGNSYVQRWIEGDIDNLEDKASEVNTLFLNMIKGS